jgi:DNA-binding NarL/FixJ family response regulator
VVDAAGNASRLVGVAQDVSEARITSDVLQRASADMELRARELQRLALGSTEIPAPAAQQIDLSRRQLEILQLVAEGLTNAAIAKRLFLSENTVKWHVKTILERTGSANRTEAVVRVLGTAQLRRTPI